MKIQFPVPQQAFLNNLFVKIRPNSVTLFLVLSQIEENLSIFDQRDFLLSLSVTNQMILIMRRTLKFSICCIFYLLGSSFAAEAQIQGSSTEKGDSFKLEKHVPKGSGTSGPPPPAFGTDGKAKRYYIIQLARFEKMYTIPEEFPSGTTLWLNPDIGVEAILITTQMYRTYETAYEAAEKIKKEGKYPSAFARPHPFMVKYE
ncbi:MAG: hypothetical protein KDC34_02220 [Saprospiraceae bacterium]|nr:hypothetical protein [Saprospiraceae bacterium]